MQKAYVVRGTMSGPHSVELDESVPELSGPVEVVLRLVPPVTEKKRDVFDFIASHRGGTRTKEDIDRQIEEERASWGDQ